MIDQIIILFLPTSAPLFPEEDIAQRNHGESQRVDDADVVIKYLNGKQLRRQGGCDDELKLSTLQLTAVNNGIYVGLLLC